MCLILLVVFSALCISFAIDGMTQNAIVNGVIALVFAILLAYRIYKNKKCLFKKDKNCRG